MEPLTQKTFYLFIAEVDSRGRRPKDFTDVLYLVHFVYINAPVYFNIHRSTRDLHYCII